MPGRLVPDDGGMDDMGWADSGAGGGADSGADGGLAAFPCPFATVRANGFSRMPTSAPNHMWSGGHNDLWIVGQDGRVGHFDGTSLQPVMGLPLTAGLSGVSGSGPSDVWISGAVGVVLHYDGKRWSSVPTGTSQDFGDIWAPRSDRVWVLASDGSIYRWDGAAFHAEPSGTTSQLNALWGILAPDGTAEIWAVGAAGTVVHGTSPGGTFAAMTSPITTNNLLSIWGSSRTDIWVGAGTGGGPLYHWDGASWTSVRLPPGCLSADAISLWGSSANDVWVAGADGHTISPSPLLHWDGTRWNQLALGSYPKLVTGNAAGDVWAIGADIYSPGLIWRDLAFLYQGTAAGMGLIAGTHTDVVFSDGTDSLWSLGTPGPLHWNGTTWTQTSTPVPIKLIAQVQPSDIWAVSGMSLQHWDGASWNAVATLPSTPTLLGANAHGEAWLWDGSALVHWDGAHVATEACALAGAPTSYRWFSLFSGDAGDVWVLGVNDAVKGGAAVALHRTTAGCATGVAPPANFLAKAGWAATASDAWVSDQYGQVARFDGTTWTLVDPVHTVAGAGLWGLASDDVWSATLDNQVMHWDGHAWSRGVCSGAIVYVGSMGGKHWAATRFNGILTE